MITYIHHTRAKIRVSQSYDKITLPARAYPGIFFGGGTLKLNRGYQGKDENLQHIAPQVKILAQNCTPVQILTKNSAADENFDQKWSL